LAEVLLVEEYGGEGGRRGLEPCRVAAAAGEGELEGELRAPDDLRVERAEPLPYGAVGVGLPEQDAPHRRGGAERQAAGEPGERPGGVARNGLDLVLGHRRPFLDERDEHVDLAREVV